MNSLLDLYCERRGPGFWAEPLNAASNLSFLLAAFFAWRSARRRDRLSIEIRILIGLAATVGIGSFLFHTFATVWAMYSDVVPILLFQLFFTWVYSRTQMRLGLVVPLALMGVLVAASLIGLEYKHVLNGSVAYVPAWLLLTGFGIHHLQHARQLSWTLLTAALTLLLALFFRTIDLAVCDTVPFGTHFLWHLLNGLVLYLAIQSLILNPPRVPTPS